MSSSPHGTRVIQKLVETVKDAETVSKILNELRGNVVDLSFDSNGNHVIQKSISHFDTKECDFIFVEICKNLKEIGVDKHGCCVIQRCCDYA